MPNPLIDIFFQSDYSTDNLKNLLIGCKDQVCNSNSSRLTPLKAAVMQADVAAIELLWRSGALVDEELLKFAEEKYPHKWEVCEFLKAIHSLNRLDESCVDIACNTSDTRTKRRF